MPFKKTNKMNADSWRMEAPYPTNRKATPNREGDKSNVMSFLKKISPMKKNPKVKDMPRKQQMAVKASMAERGEM
mgnify:FL=1|tara:strand:- start:315 stop:539 length:225 start_codon:yes stop_codon:yes gene_type:complete